jgi:hypothetical protein
MEICVLGPSPATVLASLRRRGASATAGAPPRYCLPPALLWASAPISGNRTAALTAFAFPDGARVRAVPLPAFARPTGPGLPSPRHPRLALDAAWHAALFGASGLRRGPRTHVFLLRDDEAALAYCYCLAVFEPVSPSAALALAGGWSPPAAGEEDVVVVPRVFVAVSRHPVFPLLHEALRCCAAHWQRDVVARLLRTARASPGACKT